MSTQSPMFLQILFVGGGGFCGSVSRYLAGLGIQRISSDSTLPWGTVTVNMAGCFLIGLLGQLGEGRIVLSSELRLAIFTGFLGGFTTFSSFGYETLNLLRQAQPGWAMTNAVGQLVCGLCAVWIGLSLGRVLS